MPARFFRLQVIAEIDDELEAEGIIDDIVRHYSRTFEIWSNGSPKELTKEEIMDFFDYDEKIYREMVLYEDEDDESDE